MNNLCNYSKYTFENRAKNIYFCFSWPFPLHLYCSPYLSSRNNNTLLKQLQLNLSLDSTCRIIFGCGVALQLHQTPISCREFWILITDRHITDLFTRSLNISNFLEIILIFMDILPVCYWLIKVNKIFCQWNQPLETIIFSLYDANHKKDFEAQEKYSFIILLLMRQPVELYS